MKTLAAVIELSGKMKEEAYESLRRLKEVQNISFIYENSPCPHLMLVSGIPFDDRHLMERALDSICSHQNNFDIIGNGLGIFVREQPVLYIRWSIDQKIINLQKSLLTELRLPTDFNWIAKTSLAYKDTSYSKLEQSLTLLMDLEYSSTLVVSSIALYQLEQGKREIKLKDYKFCSTVSRNHKSSFYS